jgi:DNA-binding transcriptional regulator YdaS (Cro superfamily)
MEKLRTYLNDMPPSQQAKFAKRSGTTIGYLRKALSAHQKFSAELCINLVRESGGQLVHEDIRPDVDWISVRKKRRISASRP